MPRFRKYLSSKWYGCRVPVVNRSVIVIPVDSPLHATGWSVEGPMAVDCSPSRGGGGLEEEEAVASFVESRERGCRGAAEEELEGVATLAFIVVRGRFSLVFE